MKDGPKEVKRKFQELYTIPWYNPGFFNKWDVYERLSEDESALALFTRNLSPKIFFNN